MGVLWNQDHERFCQALHRRVMGGEKAAAAAVAAYRETIYQGTETDDQALAPNARRLRNQRPVRERLTELRDLAFKLQAIDQSWALLKLKHYTDFNVDDYLTAPNESGIRFFDVGKVPRDKLALLSELTVEEFTEGKGELATDVRRTKIKGHDPIAALALMARIGGWEAPKKIAPTNPAGDGPAGMVHVHIDGRDAVVF